MAPLKRSKHIVPLSRDHHHALLFCWKIRQGLKKKVDNLRISEYVRYFWETHLKAHFREEETLLFNQVVDYQCGQALLQHIAIERLAGLKDTDSLSALADLMERHIRFEERELFPLLEARLPADVLARAGEELAVLHANPAKDDYADEFWR